MYLKGIVTKSPDFQTSGPAQMTNILERNAVTEGHLTKQQEWQHKLAWAESLHRTEEGCCLLSNYQDHEHPKLSHLHTLADSGKRL